MESQRSAEPITRKRRWFRFSLRTLLVLVALCAVLSGIVAVYVAPYYREQRLIATHDEICGRGVSHMLEPRGPWWLQEFADGKYAQRVVLVGLACDNLDELDLAGFRNFRHLRVMKFWITPPKIPGDSARQLGTLSGLESLAFFDGAGIGNEELAHLRGLTNLTELTLHTPTVTDDGLKHVGELTSLQTLDLECDITEDGLRHIRSLTNLRKLTLEGDITDDGLKHIGSLTNLRELVLRCRVTDSGMTHLTRLENLETLDCRGGYPHWYRAFAEVNGDTCFEFVETPLPDALEFIGAIHALTVRLESDELRTAGINPDTPMTVDYKGVALKKALDSIVESLGVVWFYDDHGITITTKEVEARRRPGLAALRRNLKKLKETHTDW